MPSETRFIPPGIMIVAFVVAFGGLILAVIASPVLPLHGGGDFSFLGVVNHRFDSLTPHGALLLLKALVGLAFVIQAYFLVKLDERARSWAVGSVVLVGMLGPVTLSASFDRIDLVFIRLGRLVLFLVSLGVVFYLTRPSTVAFFIEKGVSATFRYRYCPVCGCRFPVVENVCDECRTRLLDIFEAESGMVFARECSDSVRDSTE